MISTEMAANEGSGQRHILTQGPINLFTFVCICVLVVIAPRDSGAALADRSPCNLTRNAAGSPTILELQCQCQRLTDSEVLADVRMFYNDSTSQRTIYSSDQPWHKDSHAFVMEAVTQETTKDNFKRQGRMKLILRQGNVTSPAAYAGRYSCHVVVITKNNLPLSYSEYLDVLEPELLPKTTATWTTTTPSTSLTTTTTPAMTSTTQALLLPNEEQTRYVTESSVSKSNLYIAAGSLCALLVVIVIFLAYLFTVWQRRKRDRLTAMQDEETETVLSSKRWQAASSEDERAAEDDTTCRPDTLMRATPRQISGRRPHLLATPSGQYPFLWRSCDELEWRDRQHQYLDDVDADGDWEEDPCYGNNRPGPHRSLSQYTLSRSSDRRPRHGRAHRSGQRYPWIAGDGGSVYPPDAGIEERQRVTFLQYPVEGKVGPSADELYLTTFSSSEHDGSDSEEQDGEGEKATKGDRLSLSPRRLKSGHLQIYRTKSAPLVVSHHHKRRSPSSSNATRCSHTASVGRHPRSKATVSKGRNAPAKERAPSHAENRAGRVALHNQSHPPDTRVAAPMLTRQGRSGKTSKSRRNPSSSSSRNSRQGSSRSSYSEDEHGDTSQPELSASAVSQSSERRQRASSISREKGREEGRGEDNERGCSRGERGEECQTSSSMASPTTFPFAVTTPGLRASRGGWSDESCSDQDHAGRRAEAAAEGGRGRTSQDPGAPKETAALLPLHAVSTSPATSRRASDSDSDALPGLKRHKARDCCRGPPAQDYTGQRADTAGDPVLGPELRHADRNQTHRKRPASRRSRHDDDDQDDGRCPPEPGPGGDDAVDLQTRAGAGTGQARGSSHVAPAGKGSVPRGEDRRSGAGRKGGLGDRRDQAGGSQVRDAPQTLHHHGPYPVPVDCAADLSINGRSGSALQGKGLQKKDSNASSSSSSLSHGGRERFRGAGKDGGGAQGSGAFALLGVEVVSTPEHSSQFLHVADNHHSTTPKARLE